MMALIWFRGAFTPGADFVTLNVMNLPLNLRRNNGLSNVSLTQSCDPLPSRLRGSFPLGSSFGETNVGKLGSPRVRRPERRLPSRQSRRIAQVPWEDSRNCLLP